MTGKRIVFTGGTGKAGRHVVPHLKGKGYDILNVDLKPLDHPGRQHADHRPDGQRPGLQCPDHAFRLRRFRSRQAAGGAGCRRAFRRHPARADRAGQQDLPRQHGQHLQCDRSRDEARRPQGRHRLQRNHLWRLLCRRRQGLSPASRSRRTTTSTRWTATACPRWSTRRPRAPSPCATASTSTRCASAMSSSRMNTTCFPASWPTRCRASAMPGAISTPATSARSCILHREGRTRLSGLQRRQRHHHRQHADRATF